MLRLSSLCALFSLFLAGCSGQGGGEKIHGKELKEPLIQENKKIAREEDRQIEYYIDRHKWDMEATGTGLRYMIYTKGNGMEARDGMRATVEYEISLTDGTICYSSIENGPKSFVIGHDNVESGVHEGILHMNVGDKAKLIIPSYLAHGLIGDKNKIPPRSTLIVDLHLIRLD